MVALCFASPVLPDIHQDGHASELSGSSSSLIHHHHDRDASSSIPPLSHYTVSTLNKVERRYEQIEPKWDDYKFHMIRDHPINAARYREALDQDLKDGLISEEKHAVETGNSKLREWAVQHVLYGGIVKDQPSKAVVHGPDVKTDSLYGHMKSQNIAQFQDWGLSSGRQRFQYTGQHENHKGRELSRQRKRVKEMEEVAKHPGSGLQADTKRFEPAHLKKRPQATDETQSSPSPPSSPDSPPRKKAKDEVFGHKAWQ